MQQTTRVRNPQQVEPQADAGPYTHDLPVTHGGGQPVHVPRRARQDFKGSWKWGSLIILNFAAHALHDESRLTQLESYAVVYGIATVFMYWVGERPKQSFLSWTLKVVGIWLNCYVWFVTMPESLRGLIPEPLAFGLPAFVVTLIFYWGPSLGRNSRTCPFWQWLLCAAAFAAFWGWMGPALIK